MEIKKITKTKLRGVQKTKTWLCFRFLNNKSAQNFQLHSIVFPKHLQANCDFNWLSMKSRKSLY